MSSKHIRRWIGVIGIGCAVAAALPVLALATTNPRFGGNWLSWNQCCSGQALSGTRAFIRVDTSIPDDVNCITYANWVTSNSSSGHQIAVGGTRCGSGTTNDRTCSLTNNSVRFVAIMTNGSDESCVAHGPLALGETHLYTLDDCCANGNVFAYIDGSQLEGSGGYDGNNDLEVGGEYSGAPNCLLGWIAQAEFTSWERWTLTNNTWNVVQGAFNFQGSCWHADATTQDFYVTH